MIRRICQQHPVLGWKRIVPRHIVGALGIGAHPGQLGRPRSLLALLNGVDGDLILGDLGYRADREAEGWAEEAGMLVLTRADAP